MSEELEFYDSGDGVEYEVWQDVKTKKLYSIPLEIVRNYDEKEEVCSPYCAKFSGCQTCLLIE